MREELEFLLKVKTLGLWKNLGIIVTLSCNSFTFQISLKYGDESMPKGPDFFEQSTVHFNATFPLISFTIIMSSIDKDVENR